MMPCRFDVVDCLIVEVLSNILVPAWSPVSGRRPSSELAAGNALRIPPACERWDLAGCPGRAEVKTVSMC
jgi:hypothetical protein